MKILPAAGLLCILSAGISQASTVFNVSTGTATYDITSDTNGGTDADYVGTAFDVTSLPTGAFAHIPNGLSNGTNTGVWVGPNVNESSETNSVTGSTTYTVSFDLTGYDLSTASLVMSVGADDFVSSIDLNSTNIFTATGTQITGGMWGTATSISTVTSGFISGLNTITFIVPNSTTDGDSGCCGPTGLIVAADVFATATPEPATAGTTALCLVGLAAMLRRRKVAAGR